MFILLPDIKLGFLTVMNVYRLTDHVNDNTKLPILIFPEGGFYLIWIVSPSVDALQSTNSNLNPKLNPHPYSTPNPSKQLLINRWS